MTISLESTATLASAPVEVKPEMLNQWEEDSEAGVRAFRGILYATGFALVLWCAFGIGAWALFQLPPIG